jgi:hypothetical protein
MSFEISSIAIAVSLLSLGLALTSIWLIADFTKRVLAEAKRVIDASTLAIWTSLSSHEKNLKVLAKNQETLAGELTKIRDQFKELEMRQRDLLGRVEAHRQEIDLVNARFISLARLVTPSVASASPSLAAPDEDFATATNGSATLDKLRRSLASKN